MTGGVDPRTEGGPTGPVIRDKRKVDPQTGQVRETVAEAQASEQSDAQAESVRARPTPRSIRSTPAHLRTSCYPRATPATTRPRARA